MSSCLRRYVDAKYEQVFYHGGGRQKNKDGGSMYCFVSWRHRVWRQVVGPIHTRRQSRIFGFAVWTLPFTIVCFIICIHLLPGALHPGRGLSEPHRNAPMLTNCLNYSFQDWTKSTARTAHKVFPTHKGQTSALWSEQVCASKHCALFQRWAKKSVEKNTLDSLSLLYKV